MGREKGGGGDFGREENVADQMVMMTSYLDSHFYYSFCDFPSQAFLLKFTHVFLLLLNQIYISKIYS